MAVAFSGLFLFTAIHYCYNKPTDGIIKDAEYATGKFQALYLILFQAVDVAD